MTYSGTRTISPPYFLLLMKDGLRTFNAFREECRDVDIDLSGADLSKMDLRGVNLSFARMQGTNLEGANLTGADLSHANLRDANLTSSQLVEANLMSACLEGAKLDSASMLGASFSHADLHGASGLSAVRLATANLFFAKGLPEALQKEIIRELTDAWNAH